MLRQWTFLLFTILAPFASAHHSRSGFDLSVIVEVRGEVVDFTYRSPHSYITVDGIAYIDGVRQSAQVERWRWETESVPALTATGVTAATYKTGDAITLSGNPSRKEGFKFALMGKVSTLNGAEFKPQPGARGAITAKAYTEGGVSAQAGMEGLDRLNGRWVPRFNPGTNSSALPLNAAGLAAWNAYDPQLSPANTCESMGVPEIFHAPFYLYDIKLSANQIVLTTEAYEIKRTVPLDGSLVLADGTNVHGSVRGHIENDTLILESSGFPASRWGLGAATQINGGGADVPSSTGKTLTERYSISEDGSLLYYDYTLNDPMYLSTPYSYRVEFIRVPADAPMYPYDCDPESAAMFSRDAEEVF